MSDIKLRVSMEDANGSVRKGGDAFKEIKRGADSANQSVKRLGTSARQSGQSIGAGMQTAWTATSRLVGIFGATLSAAAAVKQAAESVKSEYEALAQGINDAINAQIAFNNLRALEKGGTAPVGATQLTEELSKQYEARGISFQAEDIAGALAEVMPQAKELGMQPQDVVAILAEMLARSGDIEKGTLQQQAMNLSAVLRTGSLRSVRGLAVSDTFAEELMGETNPTARARMVVQEMQKQFQANDVLAGTLASEDPFVRTQLSRRSALIEKERLGQREAVAAIAQENEYQIFMAEARKRGIDPERAGAKYYAFPDWAESKRLDPKSAIGAYFRTFDQQGQEQTILEWFMSLFMNNRRENVEFADKALQAVLSRIPEPARPPQALPVPVTSVNLEYKPVEPRE